MGSNRALSRRRFLKSTSALALCAGAAPAFVVAAGRIPVGVQLYCVRRELARDFERTMEAVARIGFEGVEFADYFGRSAAELRSALDQNGLKCCGTHIFLTDMLGDRLKETVEFNQTIGNPYLIVRWLDESLRKTPEAFEKTVGLFNQAAEGLRPFGMRVGYHNHDYIFERFGGKTLWNILADGTPRDVVLQLDTGHAARHPGAEVIDLLERNPGRTTTIHIKPYSSENPAAYIGDDELDWPRIVQLCRTTAATEWYIVEYEVEGTPPLEALRENYERFKAML